MTRRRETCQRLSVKSEYLHLLKDAVELYSVLISSLLPTPGYDDEPSNPNSSNDLQGLKRKGSRGSMHSRISEDGEDKENEEVVNDEEEALLEDERVWKRRHSAPKRRGSSEADVHGPADHALLRVSR